MDALNPGSLDKYGYSASEPGKIAIFRAIAKAMIGQHKKQGEQTENRYNHERQNHLLFSKSPVYRPKFTINMIKSMEPTIIAATNNTTFNNGRTRNESPKSF